MSSSSHALRFQLGFNDETLALVAAAIVLLSAVFWSAHLAGVEKVDFSLTYVGARLVRSGLGSRVYDVELQRHTRDSLFANPSPILFEHPPFEAVLFSPLATLPFRAAYLVWGLIDAVILLLLMFFMRAYFPWPRDSLGYVFLWLFFAPLAVALYQGQTSIVVLALFALAFVNLKSERELPAGVALGFALLKFQFVLPFVFIFLLRRRWRFLGGFALSCGLLALVSIVGVGFRALAEYARLLLSIESNPGSQSYGSAVDMPTIHGFVYAVLGRWLGHTELSVISGAIAIVLLVWVACRWQSARSECDAELLFAAAVSASLLAGSHMFTHDFSPLIVPMFVVAARFREMSRRWRVVTAVTLAIFWTFPIYFACVAWHCLYLMCPILLLFLFSAVLTASASHQDRVDQREYVRA